MKNKFEIGSAVRRLAVLALVLPGTSWSADAPASKITWGGFIDSYYGYDFNNPSNHDRSFTTQPARHNEFNINLAFIEAKLAEENVRGRLALQAGTSVQSNYAGEPSVGAVSGPTLSRHIQEAFAGYRLADNLWVDGGIFFSHIGMESFISRDNWTYTRSLVADYSPYYQTGVKFSYQPSQEWGFQLHILNGWQNISENNDSKSVGTQISYSPSSKWSATYNTLIGKELEFRHFHDVVLKYAVNDDWQMGLQGDLGFQSQAGASAAKWYGAALIQRYALTKTVAIAGRVERYFDDRQIIITTGTPNGFQTWGASANVDVQVDPRMVWRTELRGYWSRDSVFPTRESISERDGVVVTSLSVSL